MRVKAAGAAGAQAQAGAALQEQQQEQQHCSVLNNLSLLRLCEVCDFRLNVVKLGPAKAKRGSGI